MSTSPDHIALTNDQRLHLARLADQTGQSWDVVFERALASLEHEIAVQPGSESVFEAMKRIGLLGSISDAPADLSVNPTYMDGFGER